MVFGHTGRPFYTRKGFAEIKIEECGRILRRDYEDIIQELRLQCALVGSSNAAVGAPVNVQPGIVHDHDAGHAGSPVLFAP